MLSPEYRLRSSPSFGRTIRHGRKKGSRTVVAYVLQPFPSDGSSVTFPTRDVSRETSPQYRRVASDRHPRVGLVVSKAVGNAVTRHGVARYLRHGARDALRELEPKCGGGSTIVLRALPAAATATQWEITKDVHSCIRRAIQ